MDSDAEAGLNILAAVWHMAQRNDLSLGCSNIILACAECQPRLLMIRSRPQGTTGPAVEGLGQPRD